MKVAASTRDCAAGPILESAGLEPIADLPSFRALHVGADEALLVRGLDLYRHDHRAAPVRFARLLDETPWKTVIAGGHRLLRRALRFGPRCATRLDDGAFLVATGRAIYHVSPGGDVHVERALPRDRRPLGFERIRGITGFDDAVVYGDYGSNASCARMALWQRDPSGAWRECFAFPDGAINHVHAIVPDPHRDCVWILTGDYGDAAAMWMARGGFSDVERVGTGQRFRACTVFPLADGLLYATDSHTEKNSVRLLRPEGDGWASDWVADTVGSCLCATRIHDTYFFSTAVEPGEPTGRLLVDLVDPRRGPGILEPRCTVVGGNLERGFAPVISTAADVWPKRLFGFSVLQMPDTSDDASILALTGAGVAQRDEVTTFYRVSPR